MLTLGKFYIVKPDCEEADSHHTVCKGQCSRRDFFFLAARGLCFGAWALCCSAQAFSSSGEQGLPCSCGTQASRCGGFS